MEYIVTVGNSAGRSFSGSHGDGVLTTTSSTEGNATNTDWPGIDSNSSSGVTGAAGGGFRGGSSEIASAAVYQLEISNRAVAGHTWITRSADTGGRAARTSPEYE